MRLTIVLCSVCVSALLAAGQLTPKGSMADHTLRALRQGAAKRATVETQLLIREVPLDIKMPNGRDQTASLQVLFDPESKFFQWRLVPGGFPPGERPSQESVELPAEFTSGSQVAYVSKDALVTFTLMPTPPTLYVKESRDHADSISDATAASFKAAAKGLDEYQNQGPSYGRAIRLLPQLTNTFFCTPPCTVGSANIPVLGGAKITGVSMQNGEWEIVVKGQWEERIVLNDKFELVRMTRVN